MTNSAEIKAVSFDTNHLSAHFNEIVLGSVGGKRNLETVLDELAPLVADALKSYYFYNVDHALIEALKFRPDFRRIYKDPAERNAFYTKFYRQVEEKLNEANEGSDNDVLPRITREKLRGWCKC